MDKVAILPVVCILLSGCAGDVSAPENPVELAAGYERSAQALYAQATQRADATRAAMDLQARATTDVLNAQALATRQFMDIEATQQAMDIEATQRAAAWNATVTASSIEATQEAKSARATSTMQAAVAAVESTAHAVQSVALDATARSVRRDTERAEATQMLATFTGWALLFGGILALVIVVWYLLPVLKARWRVIRRASDEGEPLVMLERNRDGSERFALPLRSFWHLMDTSIVPQLPSEAMQDRASARQQLANVVSAGRGDRRRAVRQLSAQPGDNNGIGRTALPPEAQQWPRRVNLLDLFADRAPSLNNLVVGITVTADGRHEIVSASLHQLMHILNVGASGWGKSTWLRSFLWQLALAREPVEVVAVDVSGSEFNLLHRWSKLRYPVARNTQDAKAVLSAVSDELARRKELFERFPLATKLPEYNHLSGDSLSPLVVVADEGAALLKQGGAGKHLRDAIQTARQYGIYCLLASVSATYRTISTEVRDQFSTRLCFRTSISSSRIVLDDKAAGELAVKGRAWIQLAGKPLLQIQGPFVSRLDFLRSLTNGGPTQELPEELSVPGGDDQAVRIRELAGQGLSKRQIALEVFGYAGGAAYGAVTEALQDGTTAETRTQASSTA